jgi:hypothetical protein
MPSVEEVRFRADPKDEGVLAESTKPRFGLEALDDKQMRARRTSRAMPSQPLWMKAVS